MKNALWSPAIVRQVPLLFVIFYVLYSYEINNWTPPRTEIAASALMAKWGFGFEIARFVADGRRRSPPRRRHASCQAAAGRLPSQTMRRML